MRYAQTGIRGYVPPGQACPGHSYEDRPDQSDPHMNVDCRRCEPYLSKDPLWSADPAQVPLTELEQRQADKAKQAFDAVAAQSVAALSTALMSGALPQLLAALQGQGAVPAAPALPAPAVPAAPAPAAGTPSAPAATAPAAKPKTTRARKPAVPRTTAKTRAKTAA